MLQSPITPALEEVATARRIAASLADRIPEQDATGAFPHEHLRLLGEAGLLALTAPVALGGRGLGLGATAAIVREVAKADPSTALVLVMHYASLATLSKGRWDPTLAARVVEGGARRGELINALRVEPDLGTPMRGGLPATTARRTATGWCLTGRKIYSTGSEGLTWGLVWARTDEDDPRVGQFLVPLSAPGVRIEHTWDTLGLRSSASHDVVFEDVELPAEYAADIRKPADWATRAEEAGAWISLLIAALYTGVAEAARDWIVGFLKTRVPANLGRPLAELPRQQEAVGGIEERLAVNLRLIRSVAADVDAGSLPPATEIGFLKHVATENAIAAVDQALKLAGNHGIARRNPLERHWRDVLCGRIHSPQEDTILVNAGRLALGL